MRIRNAHLNLKKRFSSKNEAFTRQRSYRNKYKIKHATIFSLELKELATQLIHAISYKIFSWHFQILLTKYWLINYYSIYF